jgi:hypothetical protein
VGVVRRELHCGPAILSWLRDTVPPADAAPTLPDPDLLGVPVVHHVNWPGGMWQLRQRDPDGESVVERSGQIGEPGEQVVYVPNHGFVAISVDVT